VALPAVGLTFVFSRGADGGDGRLVAENYAVYAWMSFAVVVAAISITCWFTRGTIPHLPVPPSRRRLSLFDPLRDVLDALRNRNFRRIFVALLLIGASTGVSVALGYYTNTYFWEFSAAQVGLILSSSVIGTTLASALLRPLVTRFEKKHILLASIGVMIANGIWFPGARLLSSSPPWASP
jgi:Na+/melibiose symporter-like transporter